MPDTIATLARRLTRLERRVRALERAEAKPNPPWHDVPLTGDTSVPDPAQPPQVRHTSADMLEFSGRIGLPTEQITNGTVIAHLPELYRPATTRAASAASDARHRISVTATGDGHLAVEIPEGGTTRATWLSLDSIHIRLDRSTED